MKNIIPFLVIFFVNTVVFSQKKSPTEKAKDSIKTEIVNVTTSYSPKVTDAFKVKRNPDIRFNRNRTKEKMEYQIFSAPVASTFIPKSGKLKNIDLGKRERLYPNYIAAGFGNNITPFVEAFVHQYTRFNSEYGVYAKYTSSSKPVKNALLNSSFSNFDADVFYKEETRYFDWNAGIETTLNSYHFYGLPTNINFNSAIINGINSKQNHNFIALKGGINVEDSYIKKADAKISYFFDKFKSKEYAIAFTPSFNIPLYFINRNENNITLNVALDYLGGKFAKSYQNQTAINYSFFTGKLHPKYQFNYKKAAIKLGAKLVLALDTENSLTHFLMYPDFQISYPILKNVANMYIGANGDLHNNSYKSFTDINPYVSPTLQVTQTNERYSLFAGVNGKVNQNISYNTRISYTDEEDKALFISNNSKSDGTTALYNGVQLLGYEYGNSFSVLYDNIKTLGLFGELEYEYSKKLSFGGNTTFNFYTTTQQDFAWNLPSLTGGFFTKYKTHQWYAGIDLFVASERKDVIYNNITNTQTAVDIKGFFDVNLNGGYHFDDTLSAFIKLNNVLNNNYFQYNHFNVRGFQVLGGITWKFDF